MAYDLWCAVRRCPALRTPCGAQPRTRHAARQPTHIRTPIPGPRTFWYVTSRYAPEKRQRNPPPIPSTPTPYTTRGFSPTNQPRAKPPTAGTKLWTSTST
eukprot:5156092-Prymnesium_polylepis.1